MLPLFGFKSASFRGISCCVPLVLSSLSMAQTNSTASAPPPKAAIAVNEDILPDYHTFVNNRPLKSITFYGGKGARRDVIELVLMQQALILGGFSYPVVLSSEQSYLRSLRNIADGKSISSGGTVWLADIEPLRQDLWASSPAIKEGDFLVGIYGLNSNPKLKAVINHKALAEMSAVTSRQWHADNEALKNLGVTKVIYSNSWFNMLRMIQAKRADFTLAPFQSNTNMAIAFDGESILPARGIRVALPGSRHWPVSKTHPLGQPFYDALQRGLAIMEKRDTLRKAYTECGFYNSKTKHWPTLNTAQQAPKH